MRGEREESGREGKGRGEGGKAGKREEERKDLKSHHSV